MTDNENEHVKLAQRITDMLCQLNEGKALDTKQLAEQHRVSKRTIQRDINQRLMLALPMLGLNDDGLYALPENYYLGQLNNDDIRHFSILSGVSDLFPNMDRQFLHRILNENAKFVYESKGQFNEDGTKFKALFEQLEPAILKKHKITLYYKGSYHLLEPYKLINHRSCWYLAAVKDEKLKAYRLSFVKELTIHDNQPSFQHSKEILKQLETEESIWFGQDKQEAILTISAEVADHFRQRSLLPHQQIVKEMDNGGLLMSSQYASSVQLLSLIRYWMPHIHVVSPESLQSELMDGLKGYIG
ncbi:MULTISPECIES: helix-turn-helix transcriptional regulator [Acinetobacter]|uniref:WYL domain-containing protein n=1 Tax=Acinetobacter corruptisaponis TaxID=3045147 RepID=A0ABY8S9U4_9GAMM|nr:WYL domain-containing protein [Acinetobacter sp. KCTC 92772]WHP07508.1 WYL domain-containing protein [Acinetobacter sp. KCTC 92772]